MEVTSMSSRGQVVIPTEIRKELNLSEGEKFIVVGKGDTIILQKIKMPSFEEFIGKTHEFAEKHGITREDLQRAIKNARK